MAQFEQLEDRMLLSGIWISKDAIMALPTTGAAWEHLLAAAQPDLELPNLHDQDEDTNVLTLAKAMAGVRLDNSEYLVQARDTVLAAMNTESVNGVATIADPTAVETTVTFSAPGTYLLRLTADDGDRHDEDQVTIRVYPEGAAFAPTGEAALTGSGQVTIEGTTVLENNDPDVDAGPQQVVSVNDVVTLRGTVTDDGLPAGVVSTIWEVVEPRTLALGRNLVSYVIAADLVGLDPEQEVAFRNWLR
jgi:hypothetical protein